MGNEADDFSPDLGLGYGSKTSSGVMRRIIPKNRRSPNSFFSRSDRELRDLRPFAAIRETYECLNHPDLRGPARAAFSFSACLFRITTGRFPFSGNDAGDLHEQVRNLEIQPPASLVPGLDQDVSDTIMAGLGRGTRGTVSPAEIEQALRRWEGRDLVHALSDKMRQSALAAAGAQEASAERSFRRRRFWRKNWRMAAIIAGAAVLAGILGAPC